MKDNDLERHVMDCLLIARSFKGERRRDMQELLPVHRDLMALINQSTVERERAARLAELKSLPTSGRVMDGGLRMEYISLESLYDRIAALNNSQEEEK